jgi:hypothetical protein
VAAVRAGAAGAKADRAGRRAEQEERMLQAAVLRCLAGNPIRPARFDKSWRTSAVLDLARHIYADNRFDLVPVLGDALADAGCDDDQMLGHCRIRVEHWRGCFVVDAVLDKG